MLQHLSLTAFHLRPGAESVPTEDEWLFLRIDEGFGYWMGRECGVDLPTGSALVLPPAGQGFIRASQLCDCRGRLFGLRVDALSGVLTLNEVQVLSSPGMLPKNGAWTFATDHPVSTRFDSLVAGKPNSVSFRVQLLAIVAELVDGILANAPALPPASPVPSAVDRFRQLIKGVPESELLNLSPDEIARQCHCSSRHLNRLFHEEFGVSMRSKLTELRLRKARDLLRETDAKVIHVALDSGYRHLGLFNSMFKRYIGMTPTEWRRHVAKTKSLPVFKKSKRLFVGRA